MRHQLQRLLGPSLAVLLTIVAVLLSSATALAHAYYSHSQPSIGQVLQTAPSRIDIYTDSDMRKVAGGNVITVAGPDGSRVDDGNTVVDDANRQHFSVDLQPNLPNGRYVVSFQTLSDVDGDTNTGKFAFYIGVGPTAAQKQQDAQLNGVVPSNLLSNAGSAPAGNSGSSVPLAVPVAGAVVLLLIVLTAGSVFLRRRRRAAQTN